MQDPFQRRNALLLLSEISRQEIPFLNVCDDKRKAREKHVCEDTNVGDLDTNAGDVRDPLIKPI
jgi:hypothetical protein